MHRITTRKSFKYRAEKQKRRIKQTKKNYHFYEQILQDFR